jgi:CPA1 family monovalent cation:H+ antiporter
MELPVVLTFLAVLLLVAGLVQPLADRVRLPNSVLLAIIGIVVGAAATFLWRTDLTDAFNDVARVVLEFPVGSQVFLYVFLPTLLFQTSLTLDVRRMAEDWVPILLLAVVAVLVATFVIGLALYPFSRQSLVVCLLLGAIVATTDPVAVVGIFRDIGAPGRLGRLVEGESLLNDAAAITLFGFFLGMIVVAAPFDAGAATTAFVVNLLGGAVMGVAGARIAAAMIAFVRDFRLAKVSVSVALPYLVYITAEQGFHVSGVIAVVAAGLTLNLLGPARASPDGWRFLTDVWEQMAFWASSLIFVLAAIIVPRLMETVTWGDVLLILVVVAAALAARFVVLFGMIPVLAAFRLSPSVSTPYRLVILWGGLRGAVTLALALAVTENPSLPPETKRFVAVVATGFVLFTLLVQGTTMQKLIRGLSLDKLSPLDLALRGQILAVALQNVRGTIEVTADLYAVSSATALAEARRYAERIDRAAAETERGSAISERDRITLGLVTTAARERELVLDHYRARTVSPDLVAPLLANAGALIDRARFGGRSEFQRAAREALNYGWRFRLAQMLHRYLGYNTYVARLLSDRFEMLFATRILITELQPFIDKSIVPILGERVGEILQEIIVRRGEGIDAALDAMRLQYPDYADALERRLLRQAALRQEELEYQTLFAEGLIGPELLRDLQRGVDGDRSTIALRPRLDLAMTARPLVSQLPLFASLDDEQLAEIAGLLRPVYAAPGERVVRKGDRGDAVYFIASGAVEVGVPGTKIRLGRGDFFGEIALLMGRPRQSDVVAVAYCSLLRLEVKDFDAFLASHPDIRDAIADVAKTRLAANREAAGSH